MNIPIVSIVVPCYNHDKFLSDALHSVFEQTYENWECLIINDGSPDNTEEIAKKWVEKDKRFKYFFKENGGLSSARNFGISKATGEYILTLDSDDYFEKTFIEKAVHILSIKNEVGIVSCWGYKFSGSQIFEIFKPEGGNINNFLFKNAAIGNSLFRKKCWSDVNGYDEKMKKGYEDWEFYLRVTKNGWITKIIEEPLFFYRQHKISMRIEALNNYDKEIRSYIFKKHKDLYLVSFDEMLSYFFDAIELNKKNEIKRINSIDYKLGNFILKPFRYLKKILKK